MPKKKSSTLYFGASQRGQIRSTSSEGSSSEIMPYGARADTGEVERAAAAPSAKKRAAASGRFVIGVWDVDVHSGFLNLVLDRISKAQKRFQFHSIEAMVPVGLTLSGERTRRIATAHKLQIDDKDLATNTLASDIYEVAQPIKTALELDLLVAVISPMIMDLDTSAGEVENWNLFSTSKAGIVIASAYDLREYAQEAKRSFEACLAAVVAAAVVQEKYDAVESHPKTRGCVFDYCNDRNDIVRGLRKISVCKASLNEVPEPARADVAAMFEAIREYTP